ncbi:deazapurine DNA modification protein DpdA family protein [Planosporangium mesophilum]|uniref:DeoxyPurine in DNA protein A domain-containing protein n=1 Tax=Planosporangium mesophilum TaxID=689768 RepID=A0A8J3THS7_9ACTN|nr:hypothetical protein [Planosporangium mesophilum]NJC86797.1 hypothetical protein [Planosporangium mesophilum]GII26499.1 hypothetical protein Pme01_60960 [Planosporangium mesophilum]
MSGPLFLLGTHQPGWLARPEIAAEQVPLFVSDRRLRVYKTLPVAVWPWSEDSGGFTELQKYGRWTVAPREYVVRLYRYRAEIGNLMWAAPQDWMCEPIVINGGTVNGQRFVGTHLSVAEHQRRTVANFAQLRDLAPDLPIIPVVQGFARDDYLRCVDLYWRLARIDLAAEPLVGLGSVCRRQGTAEAACIIAALHTAGVTRLHGFGFKILGLAGPGAGLTSADSLAWSDTARKLRQPALPECIHAQRHKNCANCLRFALRWRTNVLAAAARPASNPAEMGEAA